MYYNIHSVLQCDKNQHHTHNCGTHFKSTTGLAVPVLNPTDSVATAIAGVFANFPDKIAKMVGKFEDVDRAKSQGVFCQN